MSTEKLYRLLDLAKNTRDNFNLSKEELFIEYGKLVDEFEAILKKFEQISLSQSTFSPGEKVEAEISAISGLSHQFRTPLIFILTALEQMHTDSNNDEEKKKLSMMMIHAQRLFYLFKRVMALSDQGKEELQLNTGLYDFISFLKGIMASFFLLAEENKIELTLNTKETDISFYFDYEKMSEAISNILMNALRYSPAGGQIKISVQKLSPDILLIAVKDSGPGIPQAQLEAIFDRYYSLDKPFDYQKKGFGIGLYMVKEYIRMHAGTFHVNSLEGEGVEITIKIPIKKKEFKHAESEKIARPASNEISINKIASRHALMLRLEKEEMRRPRAEPINIEHGYHERDIILIVEDNKDMCGFISTLLKEYYTVVEAENGRKGIDLAKKIIPDIIVSDIIMPEVDGIQLCRELKNNLHTSHIPIIFLTGRDEKNDIIRGFEAGVDDYITKPFHINALIARIKNLIALRRQLHEKFEQEMRLQPESISLSEKETYFIDKIKALIEKNLSNPDFGVDQLAIALDISRPTLYRKIYALTGQSPNKFMQSYRLKRSVNFLKSNYGNITEVAYKVGFSSSAYFTKCFKEMFHRLPSDFQFF